MSIAPSRSEASFHNGVNCPTEAIEASTRGADNHESRRWRHTALTCLYLTVLVSWIAPVSLQALTWTATVVTALSAINRIVDFAKVRSLSPLAAWEAGFLTIIAPELFGVLATSSTGLATQEGVAVAAHLLCSCHAVVVLIAQSMETAARNRAHRLDSPPDLLWSGRSLVLVAAAVIVASAFWAPNALLTGLHGRLGTREISEGPIQAIGLAAALFLPGIVMLRRMSKINFRLLSVYLWSAPVMILSFLSGDRNTLLFAAAIPIAILLTKSGTRKIPITRILAVIAIVAWAGTIMTKIRLNGLDDPNLSEVFSASQGIRLEQDEGVVQMTSRMVDLFDHQNFREGTSVAATAVFWIPRSLWPDKPTLLGWWLPRAMGDGGFSARHSISVGYIGEGYADFGQVGALLWAAAIGCGAGLLCRIAVKAGERTDKWIIVAGMAYPAMYFAVRSPVTTGITVAGVAAWVALLEFKTAGPRA